MIEGKSITGRKNEMKEREITEYQMVQRGKCRIVKSICSSIMFRLPMPKHWLNLCYHPQKCVLICAVKEAEEINQTKDDSQQKGGALC